MTVFGVGCRDGGRSGPTPDRLEYARSRYRRLRPAEAFCATRQGSLLIDTRDGEQRRWDGLVPGAVWINRTVLEWRIDPASGATHPAITSLHLPLILLCQQGYSSILAVASLLDLGATDVTDVEGGFEAWRAAGLPVAPYDVTPAASIVCTKQTEADLSDPRTFLAYP